MVAQPVPFISPVDRIPPSNLEAEMAVLGSILVDRAMFHEVADVLAPADFYAALHETIYLAMAAVAERSLKEFDKIGLAEELRNRGMLDKIGGMAYLNSLMDTVPTAASALSYAKIVREKAILRDLIHAGTQVTWLGYEGDGNADAAAEEARTVVELATARKRSERVIRTIGEAGVEVWGQLFAEKGSRLVRVPWAKLQAITGGLSPKQLSAWLAAPGTGKTGILFDVCAFVAYRQPDLGKVVLASLELDYEEIVKRAIAHFSGIPRDRLEPGAFTRKDQTAMMNALAVLHNLGIIILDGPFTVSELRATLRKIKRDAKAIALIAVDSPAYLRDIARGPESSKHERLENALKDLRGIAQELDAHVTLAHHLNRKATEDPRKMPRMDQSRDGGNLEGTADLVILPWLPNVGYETTPIIGQIRELEDPDRTAADRARLEALGRWIIGKNRKGTGQGRWIDDLSFVGSRYTWVEGEQGRPWWWDIAEIRAQLDAERQTVLFQTDGARAAAEQDAQFVFAADPSEVFG
jgi:replicative DNA helicase